MLNTADKMFYIIWRRLYKDSCLEIFFKVDM